MTDVDVGGGQVCDIPGSSRCCSAAFLAPVRDPTLPKITSAPPPTPSRIIEAQDEVIKAQDKIIQSKDHWRWSSEEEYWKWKSLFDITQKPPKG